MNNGPHDNYRYGCVLFDDPFEHQSGWAAKAGNPARRISGTRDLASDHVWVTNLSYPQMQTSGFSQYARFRGDRFLRIGVDTLLNTHSVEDPKKGAEIIAQLTERISRITYDFCEIGFAPGREIKQMIRKSFITGTDPVMPDYVCAALEDATEYYTNCEQAVNQFTTQEYKKENTVFFQVHPFYIAQHVLALDLPYGVHWEKVHSSRIGKTSFKSFDELYKTIGGPFLARATVDNIDERYNSILNFGSLPAYQTQRQWLSSTEVEALWEIAQVHIHEFMIPKDHGPYLMPLLKKLTDLPPMSHLSLSYRIFMDCLWCAAGTNFKPAIYKAVPYDLINPATPFVRAMDREICMNMAMMLSHFGLQVTGYGAGSIKVLLNNETPEQLFEAAQLSNTIPPMVPGANISLPKIEKPITALQLQYINAQTGVIMDYDLNITGKINEQRHAS